MLDSSREDLKRYPNVSTALSAAELMAIGCGKQTSTSTDDLPPISADTRGAIELDHDHHHERHDH